MVSPSSSWWSKALRLPLTSKRGNKDFYKGTRTGNILRRKRIALADRQGNQLYDTRGRPATWNLRTHRLDETRITSYVVPPGLADTPLRPYVFLGKPEDSGVPTPTRGGYPGGPRFAKDGRGLDGRYYEDIADEIWTRRQGREEADRDVRVATQATKSRAGR